MVRAPFASRMRYSAALLLVAMAVAACAPTAPPSSRASSPTSAIGTTPTPSSSASAEPGAPTPGGPRLTLADSRGCPLTKPVKGPEEIGDQLFGWGSAFGNNDLWVGGLGDDGVILADARFVESDGSIGWKLGWWRIVSGTLVITGRRLDAPGPPLRASVPDGYGSRGFQSTGVYFPTEGCWEVTGAVGDAELTFVTFVLRT